MSSALGLRKLAGGERTAAEQLEIAREKNIIDREAATAKAGKRTRGKQYITGGKIKQDIFNAQGNKIGTETLGDAKKDFDKFEDAAGDIHYVKKGDPVPTGFRSVTQRTSDISERRGEAALGKSLADFERGLSETDPSFALPIEVLEGDARAANKLLEGEDAAYRWERIPGKKSALPFGFGDKPDKFERVYRPETDEDFDAIPAGSTYRDPDDGELYRK